MSHPTNTPPTPARERTRIDDGWRFSLGHAADFTKDFSHGTGYFSYLAKTGFGDGPASPAFDDRGWRTVDLPHDWAVALPFDARGSASHGFKAIGHRFPENSVGWYRRSLFVPESDLGRRILVEFDGIYRSGRVFVNGFLVGEEPSGYLGVSYDVTDYLNYGGQNLITVRADASMEEGWYYEGAGIYRHAWLVKTEPLHVARHGVWVRTALADGRAIITVDTSLTNDGREAADYTIEQVVRGPAGQVAALAPLGGHIQPGELRPHQAQAEVQNPALWSIETPTMHTLVTTVRQGGRVVDVIETPFGIRTVAFDPNGGFFLNGQRVTLKGSNNHQDHAGIGVALPDAMQDYRIQLLKAMGSNAYRCSHHPPTPELLDTCDRLGMVVIDENRLMGSNEWHLRQLEQMILRDRNHPSVIIWSVGNEEWAIEGNIKGARIAQTMQDYARRLDPSRITTAAISGGWGGISHTILAAGVNYIKQANTDGQHASYPWQVIIGTEETTTQATRGIYVEDAARAHLAPREDGTSGGNAEIGWRHYAARPWAAGVFYWTGFDYRGEPTPYGYPAIGSQFGILDMCGFPKDGYYYLKAWWGDADVLHIFPHWNWSGREGQPIDVTVHSNAEEVELFLNGVSQGRKAMPPNDHLTWEVAYAPGALLARGFRAGQPVMERQVQTTGAPAALALSADRPQIAADGCDVAVVTVEHRDAEGRLVPTACEQVHFALRGPGRIIGVGNGDPSSHEPDQFVDAVRVVKLGGWQAPEAAITEGGLSFEARFDAPALAAGETATLLLNALGPQQTVTLNGAALLADATPEQLRVALLLPALLPEGNVLRIEAARRFEAWGAREGLMQIHPAALRIDTPAAPWCRATFNGLAQVIVQSTGAAGEIVLEATGEGVLPAVVTVRAS